MLSFYHSLKRKFDRRKLIRYFKGIRTFLERGESEMKKAKLKISQKNNQIIFWLNSKIYRPEAVYSTAYVFIDRAYVFLDGDPKREIAVSLKGKEKLTKPQLENLKGEFLNELLNNSIRESVSRKNKRILEYIVGGAITAALEKPEIKPESENREMLEIEKEIAVLKKELETETEKDRVSNILEIAKPYEKRYSKRR